MKYFLLCLTILLCSCQTTWEENFINKGNQALNAGDLYDANFYFYEVNYHGNQLNKEAKTGLRHIEEFEENKLRLSIHSDQTKVECTYERLKNTVLPVYYFRGNLSEHIKKIKSLSKIYHPKNLTSNIISLIDDYKNTSSEDVFSEGNSFEDEFDLDNEFNSNQEHLTSDPHPSTKPKILHFNNINILELINQLSEEYHLMYRVDEYATFLIDRTSATIYSNDSEIRFYNLNDVNALKHFRDFKKYVNSLITENDYNDYQFIESVNRLVIKDSLTNHNYINSFVLHNFTKFIELNYYETKSQKTVVTRADLEKNIDNQYKKLRTEKFELIYDKPRKYKEFELNYTIKDQTQWTTITSPKKTWTVEFLALADKVISLGNNQILYIKVR